jgi:hypothetical protein
MIFALICACFGFAVTSPSTRKDSEDFLPELGGAFVANLASQQDRLAAVTAYRLVADGAWQFIHLRDKIP